MPIDVHKLKAQAPEQNALAVYERLLGAAGAAWLVVQQLDTPGASLEAPWENLTWALDVLDAAIGWADRNPYILPVLDDAGRELEAYAAQLVSNIRALRASLETDYEDAAWGVQVRANILEQTRRAARAFHDTLTANPQAIVQRGRMKVETLMP